MIVLREKTDIQSQLEENEEDMVDIMKKYKAVVQQQTVDQITMNDQLLQIEELTADRDKLRAEVKQCYTYNRENNDSISLDSIAIEYSILLTP